MGRMDPGGEAVGSRAGQRRAQGLDRAAAFLLQQDFIEGAAEESAAEGFVECAPARGQPPSPGGEVGPQAVVFPGNQSFQLVQSGGSGVPGELAKGGGGHRMPVSRILFR